MCFGTCLGSALSSHSSVCRSWLKHSHGSKPSLPGPADWEGADPGSAGDQIAVLETPGLSYGGMCCCIAVIAFGQGKRDFY